MAQKQKWQERFFGKQLTDCSSITKSNEFKNVATFEAIKDAEVLGVYFSFANVQSDDTVKKLRNLHENLNKEQKKRRIEVVQVVLWAHNDVYSDFETSHNDSLMGLPWYGMPYSEIDLKVMFSFWFIAGPHQSCCRNALIKTKEGGVKD